MATTYYGSIQNGDKIDFRVSQAEGNPFDDSDPSVTRYADRAEWEAAKVAHEAVNAPPDWDAFLDDILAISGFETALANHFANNLIESRMAALAVAASSWKGESDRLIRHWNRPTAIPSEIIALRASIQAAADDSHIPLTIDEDGRIAAI